MKTHHAACTDGTYRVMIGGAPQRTVYPKKSGAVEAAKKAGEYEGRWPGTLRVSPPPKADPNGIVAEVASELADEILDKVTVKKSTPEDLDRHQAKLDGLSDAELQPIVNLSITNLKKTLDSGDYDDVLDRMAALERDSKDRDGALAALEDRRQALKGGE